MGTKIWFYYYEKKKNQKITELECLLIQLMFFVLYTEEACTCLQVGGMGGRVDSRKRKTEVTGDGKSNQEEVSEGIGQGRCEIINPETQKTLERRTFVGVRT